MDEEKMEERVFLWEPRSFKMDRMSPVASKLRDAVSEKLFHFLGNYSDEVLAEYIVVLVCNGKHQTQARDDLEAFLGEDSGRFVAWLWDHLSKEANVSESPCDSSSIQGGVENVGNNSEKEQKTSRLADIHSSDATMSKDGPCGACEPLKNSVKLKCLSAIGIPESHQPCSSADAQINAEGSLTHTYETLEKIGAANESRKGTGNMSSCLNNSEILTGGEQFHQYESQRLKITQNNSSTIAYQSLPVAKSEPVTRNIQSISEEDLQDLSTRNAPARRLPLKAVDVTSPQTTEKRGNVWDRLGKPKKENDNLIREKKYKYGHNGDRKELNSLVEPDAKVSCKMTRRSAVMDKGCSRIILNSQADEYKMQEHDLNKVHKLDHVEVLKRKRQFSQIDSGSSYISSFGFRKNHIHDRETTIKTNGTLHLANQLQSLNQFRSEAKSSHPAISEPASHLTKSSNVVHHSASEKLSEPQLYKFSMTKPVNLPVPVGSHPPTKPECLSNTADGNENNKPMQDEMLDVKLKLRQVEMDMLKLRSKQVEMSNSKRNAPLGTQNHLEEDTESRTVLVTNVHFGASKEALLSHFTKCGVVIKVVMLTDTITAQPKGAAYVVFARKESVEKALSLSGTSFFSRVLTVMRKADMPPGFLVPAQQVAKPWCPQPFQKAPYQGNCTSSHLQWRRDQSASRESSLSSATNELGSSKTRE
ncbi:uncharacterized protein [Typha latifolia]|uniref:uncharacterized protein isoform X1 n=1 Tax=Typha latifolia TaxID=4733 RepID=UPI003C2B678E